MRGARFPVSRLLVVFGIIPAYAGSTWPGRLFAVPAGDHPRVCGEHCHGLDDTGLQQGSSPRMRGALQPPLRPVRVPGIIPAYAGSTPHMAALHQGPADHPRVCGEHRAR